MAIKRRAAAVLLALLTLELDLSLGQQQQDRPPATGMCQKDGRPYLLGVADGGLNNQRWVMLMYMTIAKRYGLAFVVGDLHLEIMGECQNTVGWQPFSTLYSLDALVDWGNRHDVKVVAELSPQVREHCCASLMEHRAQQKQIDIAEWVKGPQRDGEAVCVDYHLGFYEMPRLMPMPLAGWSSMDFSTFYLNNREFDAVRPMLQPSIGVKQQVAYVMQQVRKQYGGANLPQDGDDGGPGHQQQQHPRRRLRLEYTSVHMRIEQDFTGHCGHFAKPTNMRCWYGEAEVEALLRTKYGVQPGSLLHVASGTPLENMTTLCSTYKCFKAIDIWEAGPLAGEFGICITREIKGAIDFWIARHARAFYGNAHSSFSTEMYAEYRLDGKPADFYTESCDGLEESKCV